MEAAARAEREETSAIWSSTTNWILSEGSLESSISFETSDEDAPPLVSSGLLLQRPPEEDSSPCEVTICFREEHEIHRVYIRSTARVYEIYYSTDLGNKNNEYLCTVRCGPAAKEETSPSISEEAVADSESSNDRNMEKHEILVRNSSSNSDEDGWVEVKVPDSPLGNDPANSTPSTNIQMHYEATAEISDAGPCVSLTLRLLSLQTKTSVHVEEIYIFADPVESPSQGSPVSAAGKFGGSSLLAMLVPNLLHLPKTETGRIHDKYFSIDPDVQNSQYSAERTSKSSSSVTASTRMGEAESDMKNSQFKSAQELLDIKQVDGHLGSGEKLIVQEAYSSMENKRLGPVTKETKVMENTEMELNQKITDPDQIPDPVTNENNLASDRVEKMLDKLVSKVEKIESYCSRFEENMMKPLGCIEKRLQHLEQHFGAFVVEIQSLRRGPCSSMSGPSCDKFDSQKKGCNSSCMFRENAAFHGSSLPADVYRDSVAESKISAGRVVEAPYFSGEDSCDSQLRPDDVSGSLYRPKRAGGLVFKAPEFSSEEFDPSMPADFVASLAEPKMSPGLVVKAPEFSTEDDECANYDDTLDTGDVGSFKRRKHQTIDDALSSALTAFLDSTGFTSSMSNQSFLNTLHEFPKGSNCHSGSSFHPDRSDNEADNSYSSKCVSSTSVEVNNKSSFGSSLSSDEVEAILDTSLTKSELENKGCDKTDAVKNDATFDSLLSTGNMQSILFPFQESSGLLVSVPELPEEDKLANCYSSPDSDVHVCLNNQELLPTDGAPALDVDTFLTSKKINPENQRSNLLDSPSELFIAAAETEPPPAAGVTSEGVDTLCNENYENNSKDENDLNSISCILLPDGMFEKSKHEKISDEETPLQVTTEVSANLIAFEHGFEQRDQVANWYGGSSIETLGDADLFVKDLLHSTDGSFSEGQKNTWQGSISLIESDDEEAANDNLSINQFVRGWNEESSMDSSFDKNDFQNKVQIDESDWSSTDSLMGASGQAADIYRSIQFSIASGVRQGSTADDPHSIECQVERSREELQRAFSSMLDNGDPIFDVNFIAERTCERDLPLEVLLGETSDSEVQVSKDDVNDGTIAAQLGSSSWQRTSSSVVDQHLIDMEDLPIAPEASHASRNNEQFSSLI
ncbi:uncharacterized protein [Typha angustifolia]|uniref:uncharacterized protein n=1 Tax=Typha angustifolia TaxID=59011 RepID=UPI003C2DC479